MQGEAGRMAQRKRTDELTEQVGRTKIPPDFVSFMSRGRERNEAKETPVPFFVAFAKKIIRQIYALILVIYIILGTHFIIVIVREGNISHLLESIRRHTPTTNDEDTIIDHYQLN